MNLQKANADALAAALTGDMEALNQAIEARGAAIEALPTSAGSLPRIEEALRAGEEISRALFALKQRIGSESARLRRLEEGLAAGMGGSPQTRTGWTA